jgi:hypothetical protein
VGDAGSRTAPTEFLSQLGSDLGSPPDADGDLTRILITHILTASPATDCVTVARRAIADLAKARAAAPATGKSHD